MARVTAPTTGSVISTSTFSTPLITDYLSQTDTTAQAIASNVTVVAGKTFYTDTIGETSGAAGVTIDGVKLKDSIPYCDTITEKTGAAGITVDGVLLKDGNVALAAGKVIRTVTASTLALAATAIAVTGEAMVITGDGAGNTVATLTGGSTGQILVLTFVDALVTITDTDAHTANTVDLSAAFVSADDTTLTLFFDGTSWYELMRSVN
jgi:hypothetical protein